MSLLKPVKVKHPIIGEEIEEVHIFEICSECGREIDNSIEGYYGHHLFPEIGKALLENVSPPASVGII